ISNPTNRPRGSAWRIAAVAFWSIVVSSVQLNGVQVSTFTSTASCGVNRDCVTTDTICNAINSSIAKPVGRKNQKNVRCFIVLDLPVGHENYNCRTEANCPRPRWVRLQEPFFFGRGDIGGFDVFQRLFCAFCTFHKVGQFVAQSSVHQTHVWHHWIGNGVHTCRGKHAFGCICWLISINQPNGLGANVCVVHHIGGNTVHHGDECGLCFFVADVFGNGPAVPPQCRCWCVTTADCHRAIDCKSVNDLLWDAIGCNQGCRARPPHIHDCHVPRAEFCVGCV